MTTQYAAKVSQREIHREIVSTPEQTELYHATDMRKHTESQHRICNRVL